MSPYTVAPATGTDDYFTRAAIFRGCDIEKATDVDVDKHTRNRRIAVYLLTTARKPVSLCYL